MPLRPESATVVAARLEKKKDSDDYAGVHVTPTGSVGYETGTYIDPVTGQPAHVHGVTATTGVAVSQGPTVPPPVADHDREIIERELYEKGLPEARTTIPIAGYLYFPISKSSKPTKYKLLYSAKPDAEPLTLPLN